MEVNLEVRKKLWGIASKLPFSSPYLIELKSKEILNLALIFENKMQNYVLELGSGWGEVGVQLARDNPDTGYILMEKNRDRLKFTVREIKKYNLKNIRLLCCNFNWFLKELFEASSFHQIILNFPDPWPKMKHWHNRTLNKEFLSTVHYLLEEKGTFLFATDHGGYGRVAIRIFRQSSIFKPVDKEYNFVRKEFPLSKFEKEKQLERKMIYYLEREKLD